ncbi:unnamed protein product [Lepeophtheirus salmonis]|uniref:(salmon louse) hypothetical protein n=1 Tax=Lepeophtheirus salmonis TaxID=72036 RepID=A0A7R8CZ72_LEPSM|nr:unnamed protein product [Lepeophtheirus salmonis]CAF2973030.1 unnamed protein product [Lepeophtheirus salmonis]
MKYQAVLLTIICILNVSSYSFEIQEELSSIKNILLNLFGKYESEIKRIESEMIFVKDSLTKAIKRISKLETVDRLNQRSISNNGNYIASSPINALRTCAEVYSTGGMATSGKYFIDPDGFGGLKPIEMSCNRGTTVIEHDVKDTAVSNCQEAGCFGQTLRYSAPIKYIKNIIALSESCEQRISFQCQNSKLFNQTTTLAWWTDINNQIHSYWSGNGSTLNKACPCNRGPNLNFGGTHEPNSSLEFKIGPLECIGQRSLSTWTPISCEDLWLRGQTHSGYYIVKESDLPELVFCDLKKIPREIGFERQHGVLGDLRNFVAFDVTLRDTFTDDFRYINFTHANVNTRKYFNLKDGTFNVPLTGTYLLSLHGLPITGSPFSVQIQVNGVSVAQVSNGQVGNSSVGSSILYRLSKGDQVRLYNFGGDIQGSKSLEKSHNLHFIGKIKHILREGDFERPEEVMTSSDIRTPEMSGVQRGMKKVKEEVLLHQLKKLSRNSTPGYYVT